MIDLMLPQSSQLHSGGWSLESTDMCSVLSLRPAPFNLKFTSENMKFYPLRNNIGFFDRFLLRRPLLHQVYGAGEMCGRKKRNSRELGKPPNVCSVRWECETAESEDFVTLPTSFVIIIVGSQAVINHTHTPIDVIHKRRQR